MSAFESKFTDFKSEIPLSDFVAVGEATPISE